MSKIDKFTKIKTFLSWFLLCILILYLNIGTTLIAMQKMSYLMLSRGIQIIAIPCLILYIVDKVMNKWRIKIYDILLTLLSLFLFLSYLFAFDKSAALLGEANRHEGLLTILSYYSFFLLSTTLEKKGRNKVIFVFLLTCFYQIVLGIFQTLKITEIFGYDRSQNWSAHFHMASGTHGNPNFYSTYILLGTLCFYSMFLKSTDLKIKSINLLLTIFFLLGLIMGNTLSCILAFFLLFTITFLQKLVELDDKKLFFLLGIAFIILIFSVKLVDSYSKNRVSRMISKGSEEVISILSGNIDENTGNGRIYVWKTALSKSDKYWLFGIGIDNFSYLNNGSYIGVRVGKTLQYFDKAHNEYVQIFITEGIFVFVLYLILLFYTFKNADKKNIVFLSCVGYVIQAFFNISVINVAPIFYIFMGFLNYNESKKEKNTQKKNIMFIISKLNNGGAERVITNLSNYYHECKQDVDVIVVVGNKEDADYYPNAEIIEVQEIKSKIHRIKAILRLRKLKKMYRITTAISFLPTADTLNYYSKVDEKVIMSNRNYMSQAEPLLKKDFVTKISSIIHAKAKKKADLIVNCSKAVEYDQISHYHMNAKKMVTIPNFVDIKYIQEQSLETIPKNIKHLFDEKTILVVGRFHPQKGIPYIIRAFNEVSKENQKAKLVIMGRGEEEKIYKKFIKHYHLENQVFLIPFDANPYKYMKKVGMLVLNSIYEGFPNVLLEAMALELPIIATDCFGGSSEILDGDFSIERTDELVKAKYGILIPPPALNSYSYKNKLTNNEKKLKEAMTLLLNNAKVREHYQQMAKKRVLEYSREKIIKKWDEII